MAKLLSAHGYQGNAMDLPVANVDVASAFYAAAMGFSVVERSDKRIRKVVLERDGVRMAIAENGREPEQDGCAFHTDDVRELREEFAASGVKPGAVNSETRPDGSNYDAFFVIAPDGLCYWFGQAA